MNHVKNISPKKTILLVGLGGLGTGFLQTLNRKQHYHFMIYEFDIIDASNYPRQWLYEHSHIGQKKNNVVADYIVREFEHASVQLNDEFIMGTHDKSAENADLIVDASDHPPLKFYLNALCVQLNKPFICGGAIMFEGFVHTFIPEQSACLACVFGPNREGLEMLHCQDSGVWAPQAVLTGMLMGEQANYYWQHPHDVPAWLSIKTSPMRLHQTQFKPQKNCVVCAK